jgi:hypothetical protein
VSFSTLFEAKFFALFDVLAGCAESSLLECGS